jgi:fatty acid desaturase
VSIVGAAHQLKRESETTDHAAARGLELRPGSLYRRFATELEPRPEIYWLDLLSSVFVGWTAFAWATVLAPWSVPKMIALFVATFALYRAVLFIHELAHIKPGSLPGFELAWNLLVGLPMLVPSLMYVGPHTDHHRRRIFGTHLDPEYEPIAHWSPLKILRSGIAMFLVPPMLLLRWGVLGPISWLVPPFRRFLIGSLSTLLINGRYKRRMPTGSERDRWMLGEIGGAVVAWALMYSAWAGILSVSVFVQYYCLSAAVLMVNYARTLAAHRYDNSDVELDDLGQLLDSINLYGNSWLTALSAPVGLRYHALHHFMPALPYHSLGAVNRALLYELPAESPYRLTQVSGMIVALKDLFAVAGSSRHQLAPPESDQVSEAAAVAHGLDR